MFALILIADTYYIIPQEQVIESDVVYTIGSKQDCLHLLSMYESGYIVPVPMQ